MDSSGLVGRANATVSGMDGMVFVYGFRSGLGRCKTDEGEMLLLKMLLKMPLKMLLKK
jgi:hypothetical protein